MPRALGEHIRKRRIDLGLRQRDLARRFGVKAEVIAYWEFGKNLPAAHRYPAIVAFLGYDPTPRPVGLPDRLRAGRLFLGLTKKALGARLGLDEGTMIDVEHGRRNPRGRVRRVLERFVAGAERRAARRQPGNRT